MVLTTRAISSVTISPKAYESPSPLVLEQVAGQKLTGLLKQIGQLSDFAADIFANLLKDATATSQRVSSLASRVVKVEQLVPQVQQIYHKAKPSHFYGGIRGGQELNRGDPGHQALFVPENIPAPIARVRGLAQPPPQLAILDTFAGRSCLAQYSDPNYFFGQWLKTEEEKAQKLMAENQAKKAARKKKKKKTGAKQPKTVAAVQVKTYSAQGKEFAAEQRRAAAVAEQNTGFTAGAVPASIEEYEEEEERAGPSTASATKQIQAPQYDYGNQQQTNYINSLPPQQQAQASPSHVSHQSQDQTAFSGLLGFTGPASPKNQPPAPQPPPPAPAHYAPPPVVPPPAGQGYAPPPPVVPYNPNLASQPPPPAFPPPAVAPPPVGSYAPPPPIQPYVAPPSASSYPSPPPVVPMTPTSHQQPPTPRGAYGDAPAAPPMAPPMAPAFSPGGPPAPPMAPPGAPGAPPMAPSRSALLDDIANGATLRKAAPAPAAAPAGGRSGLLSDIRSRGVQLRKVEENKQVAQARPAIAATGAAASIAAVLARRSAITGDDEDSEDDEEEDWDT